MANNDNNIYVYIYRVYYIIQLGKHACKCAYKFMSVKKGSDDPEF